MAKQLLFSVQEKINLNLIFLKWSLNKFTCRFRYIYYTTYKGRFTIRYWSSRALKVAADKELGLKPAAFCWQAEGEGQ